MAKLYFYYAAMNAGKSTTLLQSAHNYEERDMRTENATPDQWYEFNKELAQRGNSEEKYIWEHAREIAEKRFGVKEK